jgi:hypothetical protein
MNITTIDALGRYFEALYTLNQRLLALCGTNAVDHMGIQEQYIDDVIMTLPRLIPYRFENNDIILVSKDGLLRFSDDIPLIRSEFEKLLQNHHDILVDIKRARNKLEHEMDNAHLVDSVTSPFATFSVTYIVSGEDKHICSDALISIVKDLNALFSKIQERGSPRSHISERTLSRTLFFSSISISLLFFFTSSGTWSG